jgi:hypothetical protein
MLLNEVRQQAAEIRDLKHRQKSLTTQADELRKVQQQMAEMRAALLQLQTSGEYRRQNSLARELLCTRLCDRNRSDFHPDGG